MPEKHCQYFKNKIEEIKLQIQNLENLLKEYKNTGDENIAKEIERIFDEIENIKKEFQEKARSIIEIFVGRRENSQDIVTIIFDEEDGRFIIEGDLNFQTRTSLDDFPRLIKEVRGFINAPNIENLGLPNLEKCGDIHAYNARTINLPKLKKM